jgi:ATP-dependent Clp protease adapter protein ClpS
MIIRTFHKHSAETDTTAWFHRSDIDDISPREYVEYIVNEFCDYLEQKSYSTDIPRQHLIHEMCKATCTQYYYDKWLHKKFIVGIPKRKFSKPSQWNNILESQWNDFVHSRIINYEFWEDFWRKLPVAMWENTLTNINWRDLMQYLLPFYIHRELDILLDEEIVCQEEDGNIVSWDEYTNEKYVDEADIDGKKKK